MTFIGGGGGGGVRGEMKRLCARTVTSAKPEVPYGRGSGPLSGPWKLSGFLMLSSDNVSLICLLAF